MGFYLRKALTFGPLRLNLSRSGLGLSAGVKGLRLGIGPRGTYIHAGRGGLYYRQYFNPHTRAAQSLEPDAPPLTPATPVAVVGAIETADIEQLVAASPSALLAEMNRVAARTDLAPIAAVVALAIAVLLGASVSLVLGVVVAVVGVPLVLYFRHLDVTKGTVVLEYRLDEAARQRFDAFGGQFRQFASSARIWRVQARTDTNDWKRNAGATQLVGRSALIPFSGRPPRVVTNIEVPALPLDGQVLYFFPDQIFVFQRSRVGAVQYGDLRATVGATKFTEGEQPPSDAQVVGTTWRFVNRNGGPDRRFTNNRQLPILLYGELELQSGSGLHLVLHTSQQAAAQHLADALEAMRRTGDDATPAGK